MKDPLANIRHLPPKLFTAMPRLIVDRLGDDPQAFMRTLDIVSYVMPQTPYQLKESTATDHQALRFTLTPAVNTTCPIAADASLIAPRHVCIDGHWDKEEYIQLTNANILGGMGTFTINNCDAIAVPVIQACDHSLAFYKATLIAHDTTVCFESQEALPLMHMDIGASYEAHYLMQAAHGHGAYLEYHNEPHLWVPLSPDCQGFVLLGREINAKFFLTGFKIPFGYGLYLSPYTIHSDAHLVGEHLIAYTLADDYSTVTLKNSRGDLVAFSPVEADPGAFNPKICPALWQAASQGQIDQLEALLSTADGCALVAASDNAALHRAVFNGHRVIVERLLEFDTVRRHITAIQNNALALAAYNGHLEIVERLLEFPAVQQAITADDNKALTWAASRGHLHIVERLLEFAAVRSSVAAFNDEVFREAVKMNQLAVVDQLLQINAVRDQIAAFDNEALKEAVARGYLEMVERLLSFDAVVQGMATDCQNKELLWIVKNGHLTVLNRLLTVDCIQHHIAALDNAVLRDATINGHLDVVYRLLEWPSVAQNAAAASNAVLREAAKRGWLALVNRLLAFETVQQQIIACDNEALRAAAANGHLAIVNRLLEFEAVQQNVASGYNAAFQQAVAGGHIAIVERLLLCPDVLAFEAKHHFRRKFAELHHDKTSQ